MGDKHVWTRPFPLYLLPAFHHYSVTILTIVFTCSLPTTRHARKEQDWQDELERRIYRYRIIATFWLFF